MKHAVKFVEGTNDRIEGIGLPYGGPWVGADGKGRDLYGQYFSPKTELCLDWFPERPLLYGHGLQEVPGTDVVGRVKAWEVRSDLGVWVQAELDKSSSYFDAISELIQKGKLFFSSGSVEHLFKAAKDGEILMWPWIELSLTPSPANLFATLDQPTAEKHWQAAGLPIKALTDHVKALPDAPVPVDGHDGMSAPPGSYEALIHEIQRGASRLLLEPGEYDAWLYVVATFPDHAIVCVCEGYGEADYYQIEYAVGADGSLAFGEYRRVDRVYLPAPEPLPSDEAPMALMAHHTLRSASALLERTKGLHERRASEHRSLSDGHRERMAKAREQLTAVAEGLDALLATTPDPEPAASSVKAAVEVGTAYLRLLTLVERAS